jgi:hypothetical protein
MYIVAGLIAFTFVFYLAYTSNVIPKSAWYKLKKLIRGL